MSQAARTLYKEQSNWIRGEHYAPVGAEIELVARLGMYDCCHNKNGLVRDHVFPRYGGYKFRVFPELLRHPANCQFIPQTQNSSKRPDDFAVDPSEIEKLFRRIEGWNGKWKEHTQCLELIGQYRRGDCHEPSARKRKPRKIAGVGKGPTVTPRARKRRLAAIPVNRTQSVVDPTIRTEFKKFTDGRRRQLSTIDLDIDSIFQTARREVKLWQKK